MVYRAPGRRGLTPQGRGRYPGFDVLDEVGRWDDVTAGVVLARLATTTDLSFFTTEEDAVASPLFDLLLAQDGEPRVPVVALVDARLASGETDGWRYEDMPPDDQAWRATLAALDEDAHDAHGAPFSTLDAQQQAGLVQAVFDAGQHGDTWHGWSGAHVWSLWTRYVCAAFYSHPWAWNEIGFGGPAYPRGYKNVGLDARERWEVADADPSDPAVLARRVREARAEHERLTGAPSTRPSGTRAPRQGELR
ncbi:gluconate 2-dehydrogenase subunit 3 family protein [Pseudokineococcus basanitobsidens]|uniref:Gluconate 2-dehydrogenase subunit 3 family protein n=1 Tax=Pseudokineococcus basanitobsidens TaxID=1926649 RepID=A0ABU8RM59_9ACTN